MADNTVTTKFVSDPRDEVLLQLLKQQKETTNLQKKMLSLSSASRRGAKETTSGFGKISGGLTSLISGYVGVTAVVGGWINANRKVIQQGEEIARTYDAVARKFKVQAGMKGLEAETAQSRIGKIGAARGFGFEDSFAAATQLVSSGFSAKEASGDSLTEFLKLQNATNAAGANFDPKRLAAAQAGFLSTSRLDLNAKNLKRSGRAFQGLFKSRNILPSDLEALSGVAPTLGALTIEEKLGAFAELRQGNLAPSVAATGLKKVVSSLQTASETPRVRKALERAGVDIEDVDLVGENITQVIDTLSAAVERMPEKKRAGFFKNVFGEEGSAAAQLLIKRREPLKEGIAIAGNPASFQRDLKVAESGGDFVLRRQEAETKLRRKAEGTKGAVTRGEMQAKMEEDGLPPIIRDISTGIFNASRYIGFSPESSTRIATYGSPVGRDINARANRELAVDASVDEEIVVTRAKRRNQSGNSPAAPGVESSPAASDEVRELTQAMKENTAEMKKQAASQNGKPQPVEIVNQPQTRRPVAAAALGNN